jgi:hypothetical protein
MGSSAIAALGKPQSSEVFLFLLDVSLLIDGVATTLHFVNNTVQIVRNTTVYSPLAFTIVLPTEGESVNEAQLVMDAVDLQIVEYMRNEQNKPSVTFILVLASDPNATPEAGPFTFTIDSVHYDARSLSCTLGHGKRLDGVFPKIGKTPYYFPGLF